MLYSSTLPGMVSGASSTGRANIFLKLLSLQIKKAFFGALCIRKEQDADDTSLATRRPATTVHVYATLRTHTVEALIRAREGLVPAEDAPDIIANTFLA
ncbi:hypothetical protein HYDPIDRAFT_120510 [Hydnomerulius pinastri MD-312]|uniref:Uncharacterized protein n=1 Tax=Hydnomerulius pinastri MD-312 TaxID=994086 RepID=A0A0C9W692_9AGAM|nr:hypothetical protein HYDPIDRAFT_120510 [Hydnomerulius pinastri MD-312]